MRDTAWLERRLAALRARYFAEVDAQEAIEISFGRRSRGRFAAIFVRDGKTCIRVNALLAREDVPDFVLDGTLVHELAHFAHGFGSMRPRLYAHAHRGGVVQAELARRGCAHLEREADAWIAKNWKAVYDRHAADLTDARVQRTSAVRDAWRRFHAMVAVRTRADLEQQLAGDCALLGWSESPPKVDWLEASLRHTGITYWNRSLRLVRLHGLLAHPDCPDCVVRFGLWYWLAGGADRRPWPEIARRMEQAGLGAVVAQALQWQAREWPAFRRNKHPLKPPTAGRSRSCFQNRDQ